MPAFSSFILNDGTDNHTFTPVAISTEKSVLVSREGTMAAGNPTALYGMRLAVGSNDSNVITFRLNQPIEETVDGIAVVKDIFRWKSELVVPNRRTQVEREIFWALVKAYVNHALTAAYSEDLDPLYGG